MKNVKMKKVLITAEQQGKFLADIAPDMKWWGDTKGYLMANKDGNLYFASGGNNFSESIEEGYQLVKEIFDVYDRMYLMNDLEKGYCPENFISEHNLNDIELIFEGVVQAENQEPTNPETRFTPKGEVDFTLPEWKKKQNKSNRELISFQKLLKEVKRNGNLIFGFEIPRKHYRYEGKLDGFLYSLDDTFNPSYIAKILLNGKFYIISDMLIDI